MPVLILLVLMSLVTEARAQTLFNLREVDWNNIPSDVGLAGTMPVHGDNGYELYIVEYGIRRQEKDHQAIVLVPPNRKRALGVLQLGLVFEQSGIQVELACDWEKAANRNGGQLIGLTNSESSRTSDYVVPYKAWRIDVAQSPPFVPVNPKTVRCYPEASD